MFLKVPFPIFLSFHLLFPFKHSLSAKMLQASKINTPLKLTTTSPSASSVQSANAAVTDKNDHHIGVASSTNTSSYVDQSGLTMITDTPATTADVVDQTHHHQLSNSSPAAPFSSSPLSSINRLRKRKTIKKISSSTSTVSTSKEGIDQLENEIDASDKQNAYEGTEPENEDNIGHSSSAKKQVRRENKSHGASINSPYFKKSLPRNESVVCWICYGSDDVDTLEGSSDDTSLSDSDSDGRGTNRLTMGFCLCKGSIGVVHLACINALVHQRRITHCPNCRAPYRVKEYLRPGAPPRPMTTIHRCLFLVSHFAIPFLSMLIVLILEATFRFCVLTTLVGYMYHYITDQHNVSWLRSWVVGSLVSSFLCMARRSWRSFSLFFDHLHAR